MTGRVQLAPESQAKKDRLKRMFSRKKQTPRYCAHEGCLKDLSRFPHKKKRCAEHARLQWAADKKKSRKTANVNSDKKSGINACPAPKNLMGRNPLLTIKDEMDAIQSKLMALYAEANVSLLSFTVDSVGGKFSMQAKVAAYDSATL